MAGFWVVIGRLFVKWFIFKHFANFCPIGRVCLLVHVSEPHREYDCTCFPEHNLSFSSLKRQTSSKVYDTRRGSCHLAFSSRAAPFWDCSLAILSFNGLSYFALSCKACSWSLGLEFCNIMALTTACCFQS